MPALTPADTTILPRVDPAEGEPARPVLDVVDVATGWTDCDVVWGKGQERVGTAVHHVRQRLPFAFRELHTDNGGEFLNAVLHP